MYQTVTDLFELADGLYKRTKIPICILNEQKEIIYPKQVAYDPQDPLLAVLFELPANTAIVYSLNEIDLFSCFKMTINKHVYFIQMIALKKERFVATRELSIFSPFLQSLHASATMDKYFAEETAASFTSYTQFIYKIFCGFSLKAEQVKNITKITVPSSQKLKLIENIYDRRNHALTLDSYQFEVQFIRYIKEGKMNRIDWLMSKASETYQTRLAPNPLQAQRYKIVALITLITRISIQEGVPLEVAFSKSDSYIQQLDTFETLPALTKLLHAIVYDFSTTIQSYKQNHYSKSINQAIQYIDSNLYSKILLNEIADYVNLAPTYLSALFSKEVGTSLKEYVNRLKIEEAASLLLFTDKSYVEISALLCFSTHSYFIKVFKQYLKCTPKDYRTQSPSPHYLSIY